MLCELCAKNAGTLNAIVEGSSIVVCKSCCKFGKVISEVAPKNQDKNSKYRSQNKKYPKQVEPSEEIVRNYSQKIRSAREKLCKNHEEFAKLISEKISTIHKLETGSFEPPLELAKKLERILKIKLVEIIEELPANVAQEKNSAGFTIGDFIKIKKEHA